MDCLLVGGLEHFFSMIYGIIRPIGRIHIFQDVFFNHQPEMIQFPDVSPSPESGLCLRGGIDLPQCLNTWPHTGAQYDLRTLDVFEHLGHYARRLWKARAAIFPFARSKFSRRGWLSIHELGSIYPIWDG
jgi:hypothetical protein